MLCDCNGEGEAAVTTAALVNGLRCTALHSLAPPIRSPAVLWANERTVSTSKLMRRVWNYTESKRLLQRNVVGKPGRFALSRSGWGSQLSKASQLSLENFLVGA